MEQECLLTIDRGSYYDKKITKNRCNESGRHMAEY